MINFVFIKILILQPSDMQATTYCATEICLEGGEISCLHKLSLHKQSLHKKCLHTQCLIKKSLHEKEFLSCAGISKTKVSMGLL
jgi:hypothetical protein